MNKVHGHLPVNIRFFVLVFLFLGCSLVSLGRAFAFQEDESLGFEDRLHLLWDEYIQAKIIGDDQAREQAFEGFRAVKKSASGEIFEIAGYLFLEEGYKDLSAKKYESARHEFLNAAEMNPYLWPAFMGLAQIKREDNGDFGKYLELNFKGIKTAFSFINSFFILDALFWFLKNLYLFGMVSLSLFSAILCVKYIRPFHSTTVHGIDHGGKATFFAQMMALVYLLLPFILGVNFFLSAVLFLVMFFPFFENRERVAAFVVFLFLLVSPLFNLFIGNVNYARSNMLLKAHLTQYEDGNTGERIRYLLDKPGTGELKNQSLLTLGLYQKYRGELREAQETLNEIPTWSRIWPMAQVNIGNIQFLGRDFPTAIDSYKAALRENPDLGTALYNLSLVHSQLGDHQEAESYRLQAFKKNPKLRAPLVTYEGPGLGTVVDAKPDYPVRLGHAVAGEGNPMASEWYTKPAVYTPSAIALVLMLCAFLHLRMRNTALLAKICEKCGRIFFPSDSPNSEWCSQCVNLYIRKDDLPSEAKIKKFEEVGKYARTKRWIKNVAQFFLPGSKKIIQGSPLAGMMSLCVWCFLLTFLWSPLGLIPHPFMRYVEDQLITLLIAGVTFVYWLIFGLLPIWQEE